MDRPKTSFREQAAAVELAVVNLRGHCGNLERLVAAHKRPQHDLDVSRGRLPALEDAAATMTEIANRAEARAKQDGVRE